MKNENTKKPIIIIIVTFVILLGCLSLSVINNNAYNNKKHSETFSGAELFTQDAARDKDVSVTAAPRSSTWGKIFDFDNEGITEENYQAYTYDFSVNNNTRDRVDDFSFKLVFGQDVYLMSAWNGALEIHQNVNGNEIVDTISDLREFVASEHSTETITVDGESLVPMKAGDYLVYIPSSSANAMEVPIEPMQGTTPGVILYVAVGESIDNSSLEIEYSFHRVLTAEPLFWAAMVGFAIWLTAVLIFAVTSAQIKKYKERHERDNIIINESIETFTGFIDAKDPYTNGHSKRVAIYTKMIAKELGYTGDELERIYYVALLHDCGKIGVPDKVLGKPGKLDDSEFEIIKSHTVCGGEVLSHFKSLKDAGEGALYHHERYDGKGYPEGKAGEDIPFIARMICVADAFDAMNTNRVYRKKLTREHIISEIETNKGKQFDPRVADVMLGLIRDNKLPIGDSE